MEVQALSVSHIPQVMSLMGLGEPFIRPRTESDYWMYATLFSSTCLVCVDLGRLAGCVIAFRSQDSPAEIYIQDLMTHPEHRRKGVAKSLVEAVARRGAGWGCQSIYLTSEPNNSAAHTTWLRLGFTNRKGDAIINGVSVVTDFKGPGKTRTVYDLSLV